MLAICWVLGQLLGCVDGSSRKMRPFDLCSLVPEVSRFET
jgi:hypothetical protein